jgi:hypothetical protein
LILQQPQPESPSVHPSSDQDQSLAGIGNTDDGDNGPREGSNPAAEVSHGHRGQIAAAMMAAAAAVGAVLGLW